MQKQILIVGIVMVLLVAVGVPIQATPRHQARSVITYPTEGTTVSGVVQITGAATHPNILWYNVSVAAGASATGGSQWITLAEVHNTPVDGGVLATWDTTGMPDGLYTLALTVRGQNDEMYYQTFVGNITVNNAAAAPPTSSHETTTTETPPVAAPTIVIASPTPVTIEQPPTATPLASPTPGGGDEIVAESGSESGGGLNLKIPISMAQLRAAFLKGSKFTLFLFALWGLYMFVKALARWGLRHFLGSPRR